MIVLVCEWFAVLLLSLDAQAVPPDSEPAARILEGRCAECHRREDAKGGLDLSTQAALLRGGDSGPAVVAGAPEKSLLWRLVTRQKKPYMPHKREKLPEAEQKILADWIREGAPYGRELKAPARPKPPKEFTLTQEDLKHWAFQPVPSRTAPPRAAGGIAPEHPIDAFLLAKLKAAGLGLAPPASRETLLRRVTLDLVGLPPTPAETQAFVSDPSPEAWEKVLDRLLASPGYGERWGRHWLDLARYAETDGFEHDAVRPHSWRYRDYVIRSFNEDKPYDRFIREQIAGDELWPGDSEALVATGFNLLGPDMVDSSDQVQRRHLTLNDMTDTVAAVFLGLTLGCARCHNHKFEPLSQRDYYRLQAFFTPVAFKREMPVPTPLERAAFEAQMKVYCAQPGLQDLANLETPVRDRLRRDKLSKLTEEARSAVATPPERRTTEQANLALETEPLLEVSEKEFSAALSADEKARRKSLVDEARKLPKAPELPQAMTLGRAPGGPPARTFILIRGEPSMPAEEVQAGYPEVLGGGSPPPTRAALADWIAGPGNPLTARVMANRIWLHHFGRGLVRTPSELGPHGLSPTHPELLDFLAREFVAGGYSVKRLHRLILSSAAYRQSTLNPAAQARDPENALYGRMNRIRLEGEVLRDSLLMISGRLNPEMGGPGVFPPIPAEALKGVRGWTASADERDHRRRSVYIFARRNLRFPFLEVFDAPDSNLSCPERGRSTTAPQSLTLLNAEEVVAAARSTAERLKRESPAPQDQIELAYRLALGRNPTDRERALGQAFLERSPLSEFCRALFNLNAFVYSE
jgi:hypothetical protein